jgi:Zn-dependent M28 family amino/carboxypeptidase
VHNVEAELSGSGEQIIIVGAHYDTTRSSPGANDNSSGVASLLEVARALRNQRPLHTIRFVAFANGEWPFYGTARMGVQVHARRARERGEDIRAMFSLEMLGIYSVAPQSQRYPRLISRLYPDTANFVAFVSNFGSRPLLGRSIASFRRQAAFPSEGMAAPEPIMRYIRRSDHSAFWDFDYPAIMITDTGGFRYDYYHSSLDTPEHLDYLKMARVVEGLTAMLAEAGSGGSDEQ